MYLLDKIKIKDNNVTITKINNMFKIKPIEIDKECKITIYSESINIIQFKLNTKLVKNIKVKYNKRSYHVKDVPHDGVLINGRLDNTIKIKMYIEFLDLCSEINIFNIENLDIKDNKDNNKIIWDKMYIINMQRRHDRKEEMIKKLKEENIDNYEFIEAVDGQTEEIQNKFNDIKQNTNIINTGHFGCLLSHIKALEKAKEEKLNSVLVLEDDIIFEKNFMRHIRRLSVPKYDLLYMGGPILELKLFLNGWGIHKEIMGTYCYLVTSNIYDVILNEWKKNIYCSDISLIYNIQSKYDVILLNDFIKTTLKDTDTSNKRSVMNNMVNRLNINLKE